MRKNMMKASIEIIATIAILTTASLFARAQSYHLSFDTEFADGLSVQHQDANGDEGSTYGGTYQPYLPSYPARYCETGELEEYVDPAFYGLNSSGGNSGYDLGMNPFSTNSSGLNITGAASSSPWIQGQSYTSGLISTFGSFSQEYGYFECKAKLPPVAGTWPAFWMLPEATNQWGQTLWNGEIDVMECFGAQWNFQGYPTGGSNQVHWAYHDSSSGSSGNWATINGNIYTGYHVYGVLWTPSTLTYYVDGVQIGSCPNGTNGNQPYFMMACMAMGGPNAWSGPVNNSQLPCSMNVQWMRAYSNNPNVPTATPQSGYVVDPTLPISLGSGVPAQVTGVVATPGNAKVGLSWNTDSGATSYCVYRGTTSGGESGTAYASGITGTSWTDTGVTNGTKYYYTVNGGNSSGWGPWSTEVSATPTGGGGSTFTNGSFETGNMSGWTLSGSPTAAAAIHSGGAYQGTYFYETYDSSAAYNLTLSQVVTGLSNGNHTVNAYVEYNGAGMTNCEMDVTPGGGSKTVVNFPWTTSWTPISTTVNVTNGSLTVAFYTNSPTWGWALVDDVTVN